MPVVAGASGGTAEPIVDGVTGVRVDPNDPVAAAAAVAHWLDAPDQAREAGLAGRARAVSEANWDRVVAALRELSRKAAATAGPP